jgi:hypothetical protein
VAESEFSKLNPSHGMDRVEGAPGTAWAQATSGRVVRHDSTLNLPLDGAQPGVLTAAPEPPPRPPPAPPSAAERRSALADAIAARETAQEALQVAQERHLRAQAHRNGCADDVSRFDDLPARIAAHTEAALRGEGGRPDPGSFSEELALQQAALAGLNAANSALAIFAAEHETATTAWRAAAAREKLAIGAVLELERDRLRAEQKQLELKVDAFAQLLRWTDTAAPWAKVVERLLADPLGADLSVGEVPATPQPEIAATPAPIFSGTAILRNPDGTSEEMDQATFHSRLRERALREQQRPYHEREQEARARVHSVMAGDNLLSRP